VTGDVPDTLVLRDDSGSFGAGSITLDENLNLPPTNATSAGNLTLGGVSILSGPGGSSFISVDTAAGTTAVTATARFGAVAPPKSRACGMPAGVSGESALSFSACTGYCTAIGSTGGAVSYLGSAGGCSGNNSPPCSYVTDFATCATTTDSVGPCDSCPISFVCTCSLAGSMLTGTTTINGPLQVSGYVQLGATSGQPPLSGCDGTGASTGRMLFDAAAQVLWICSAVGWIAK
jgi:hypothetical protein